MIIKLNETYEIDVDAHNFTLKENKVSEQTGKSYHFTHGYYPTLESTLIAVAQ